MGSLRAIQDHVKTIIGYWWPIVIAAAMVVVWAWGIGSLVRLADSDIITVVLN
jgi:hypothetical protein